MNYNEMEKLEHNGILFPPDFETKKIKIKIKGENVDLDINLRNGVSVGKKERYAICSG